MSETLIASLNHRIEELTAKAANLQAALKQERGKRQEGSAAIEELKTRLASVETERDSYRDKATAVPSDLTRRIVELEGELKARDFKSMFSREALRAGALPDKVDDLYMLLGLKPGDDPIGPELFVESLARAREERAWAFGGQSPGPSGQNGHALNSAAPPPPGSGRSASAPAVGAVRYTRDDITKPGWQTLRPELVKALVQGTAQFVE